MIYDNTHKCYLRITKTAHGCEIIPADIKAFERARGVGERIERELAPLPNEVTLTSIAVSMARIADSLEGLEGLGYQHYMRTHAPKRRWWVRDKGGKRDE